MLDIYTQIVPDKHFTVTYSLESLTNLAEACEGIAIGQSIGNPTTRIPKWETPELVKKYCAKIIGNKSTLLKLRSGIVTIAFPADNINWDRDGFSHLLCVMQGGQTDINNITKCRVIDIDDCGFIPKLQPKLGLSGIRAYTNKQNRPLLGCIIKPKIGLNATDYASIVKEMVDGGADIIKEDEILASPAFCTLEDRLEAVQKVLKNHNIIYLTTINGDADVVLEKAKTVASYGINGVHLNIWSGLGTYRAIRKLDLPIALHYQKSGDKTITDKSNPYAIRWNVLCKLAAWSGVDTIHTGMWGSYLNDDPVELKKNIDLLVSHNVVPALSCGMNAQRIPVVTEKFGCDYLANVGSACHSHPDGVYAAVKELREAIDSTCLV